MFSVKFLYESIYIHMHYLLIIFIINMYILLLITASKHTVMPGGTFVVFLFDYKIELALKPSGEFV